MKSNILQIYVIGHRQTEEPYPDNEIYTPLQTRAAYSGKALFELRDNQGDNIGEWNNVYAEMTGVYEVYKNVPLPDFVGICQYRRRLKFDNTEEVENIFKDFDAVAAVPLKMGMSPYEQYAKCHNQKDIELAGKIIKEKYPEFSKGWDRYIRNGRRLYYSNGFVLRKSDFRDYCEFYFGLAEEFRRRRGWTTPEKAVEDMEGEIIRGERKKSRGLEYQSLVLGFLSERLLTLFLLTRFGEKKIKAVPYYKLENV